MGEDKKVEDKQKEEEKSRMAEALSTVQEARKSFKLEMQKASDNVARPRAPVLVPRGGGSARQVSKKAGKRVFEIHWGKPDESPDPEVLGTAAEAIRPVMRYEIWLP